TSSMRQSDGLIHSFPSRWMKIPCDTKCSLRRPFAFRFSATYPPPPSKPESTPRVSRQKFLHFPLRWLELAYRTSARSLAQPQRLENLSSDSKLNLPRSKR